MVGLSMVSGVDVADLAFSPSVLLPKSNFDVGPPLVRFSSCLVSFHDIVTEKTLRAEQKTSYLNGA
jgi:hypothetical protein